MNDSTKLLKSILGNQGYETLEKAIFKQKTAAVIDPLEYYLPLIVVPRTIISWLVQNIKPMKPGNILDVKFPGRDDIMIHFEKQADDQYRAEYVQGGKIIHTFEKQSLPAVSGHMMTVGELYDSFGDEKPKSSDDLVAEEATANPHLNEPKAEGPDLDMVRSMIGMSNCTPPDDPENIKWQMSHANVREMTAVIGKLVDALCAKQLSRDRFESELDKVSEKEVKDQQGKLTEGKSAEQVGKDHNKDLKNNPDIKTPGMGTLEVRDLRGKDAADLVIDPKTKVAPESKGRAEIPSKETPFKKEDMPATPVPKPRQMAEGVRVSDTPHTEKPFSKESMAPSMQAARNISSPRMAGAEQDQHQQKGIQQRISADGIKKDSMAPHAPADTSSPRQSSAPVAPNPKLDKCNSYFRKAAEKLSKPYVSDAQRRWAHTDDGTKALGGKAHVHEWDEATKGKKLPEHVKKEEKGKQVTSQSSPSGGGGVTNAKKPAGGGIAFPMFAAEPSSGGSSSAASGIAADAKASPTAHGRVMGGVGLGLGGFGKADKPMGAGQPNGPAKALAPKAPIPPSNAPAQAAAKQASAQADASGTGGYKPPKTPGAVQPKNPTMQKDEYFRNKLGKSVISHATEEQLYKSACQNCGVAEFVKDKDGNPKFQPCACFLVMKKDEEGKPYKFVQVMKKSDGNFSLAFAKGADPEVVKLFLLTLKSALLIKRKFGVS